MAWPLKSVPTENRWATLVTGYTTHKFKVDVVGGSVVNSPSGHRTMLLEITQDHVNVCEKEGRKKEMQDSHS